MRNRVGSPSALKMVASACGDRSEDPPTMGKVVTGGRISQHIENYRYVGRGLGRFLRQMGFRPLNEFAAAIGILRPF